MCKPIDIISREFDEPASSPLTRTIGHCTIAFFSLDSAPPSRKDYLSTSTSMIYALSVTLDCYSAGKKRKREESIGKLEAKKCIIGKSEEFRKVVPNAFSILRSCPI